MMLDIRIPDDDEPTLEMERSGNRTRAIGIIPLIDVAMFLLIFFMVAGTIERFEVIEVNPPQAESGKLIDEGHLVILLGTHDEIVMNDDLLNMDAMQQRVEQQISANPNKVITLKADADISATRMIHVMDRIKAAGGRNISIMTQSTPARRADDVRSPQ